MDFDLVIRNGDVVDPGSGLLGRMDVGIREGKITAVAPSLPFIDAGTTLDATGLLVTPGLFDLHTHVYWGATYWGIEPDPIAARTGVATWLDAGTVGSYSFPAFRRYVVEASEARVFALLNVSSIGLIAPTYELTNLNYCDLGLAHQIVDANRDVILGIKARIDANTTRGVGLEPLRLARKLADQVNLPLMVHIGKGPPSLEEIFTLLRAGDILTHCFTGHDNRILEPDGRLRGFVRRAWDEGLVLDIGHGTGSFCYEVA
jgi:dihydroorotase